MEEVPSVEETVVQVEEATGLAQGQQIKHVATVLPSVKGNSVLPMEKPARSVTKESFSLDMRATPKAEVY